MRHRNEESWPASKALAMGCLAALLAALLSALPLPAQTLSGATVQPGKTSLTLPAGAGVYLYAMGTGGGRSSANFAEAPYAQVVDAAGYTVAGLAITPSSTNSFSTETDYHTVGGVAVSGFRTVSAFNGSSAVPGATSAAVHFVVSSPALVVVIGIAGGETNLELRGLSGLQVDAQAANQSGVIPIVIAHTTLEVGEYDVSEQTSGDAAQDANQMGDLIGVFVFMGGSGTAPAAPSSQERSPSGGPTPSNLPPPPTAGTNQTRSGVMTVTVPAQAGPWDPELNPTFDYGSHDQAPAVAITGPGGSSLAPGTALTLKYIAGAVSIGAGWPNEDANGDPKVRLMALSQRNYPGRYLQPAEFPVNVGSLLGAFAANGVLVGSPFKVGNGPLSLTVPSAANQLLLGVNDDNFGDNSGAWVVQVEFASPTSTSLSTPAVGLAIGILAVLLGVGAFFLLKRRPSAQAVAPATAAQVFSPVAQPPAPPVSAVAPQAPGAAITSEALDRLAKLKSLLDAGLITVEEFRQQKAKLLK